MSPLCSSARHSQHTDTVPSLCHLISQQSRVGPMCQAQGRICWAAPASPLLLLGSDPLGSTLLITLNSFGGSGPPSLPRGAQ